MSKRVAIVVIGAALVAIAAVVMHSRSGGVGGEAGPSVPVTAIAPAPSHSSGGAPPASASTVATTQQDAAGTPAGDTSPAEPDRDPDWEAAMRWSMVDLDAVREALPDNLYWKMSMPTQDPDTLAWREYERARWNEEFGKVLSGTATHQEVNAYYTMRERISQDAVLFSDHLIQDYGDVVPERDLGLLHLARKLHMARLEEIPRKLVEALERSTKHAAQREAWLADEAAFGSAPPAAR